MTNFSSWKIKSAGTLLAILVISGAVIASYLALRFARSEAERDRLVWQSQVAVVINSREVALEDWLATQKKVISRLAENPSLRIYLGNIEDQDPLHNGNNLAQDNLAQDDLAQAAYLENQMKAVALQNGYLSELAEDNRVNANLPRPHLTGLALINPQGQLIVSTANMPSVIRTLADYLEKGAGKDVVISGPYLAENGQPTLAFIAPVFGVQDEDSSPAIGFAVGIKILPGDFYAKLVQPGDTSRTAKNYLVRKRGDVIEYLSPVSQQNGDVTPPLTMTLDGTNTSLAAAYAVENSQENSGAFAEKINYDGQKVLVTGRKITGTDWVLVRSVASKEIMGAIEARKRTILWIAGLTIIIVSILILLIWRHGVSVRVAHAAEQQRLLTRKYEKLSHFLRVVSDSQPTVITAIDQDGRYSFANLQAARDSGVSPEEMIGQKVTAFSGRLLSPDTESHFRKTLASEQSFSVIERLADNDVTIKTDYVPLSVEQGKAVLKVTEDISELVRHRERREAALKNLVNTLTMVIDSRDPYSSRHSERVALVALAIAREMGLDEITCETANIAGAMMNLGKILVPRELLTRPKGLSEEELAQIRSSIMKSADMLEAVDFDGPVVMTLRQARAHWDGSGIPQGLSGTDILPAARIVAVANAFVGMASARAHRPGLDMEKAALLLLNDADRIYDRKPVAALMNYLENKGGLELWQDFAIPTTDILAD